MEKKRKAVPPSVSAAESILAAVGMRTNTHTGRPYNASHGGQQMRVVHTARGTYAAFVTDFGYESHTAKFYVAKIGPDGRAVILYGGEYLADHSTPLVNIGQDTDGDVVVTVCGPETLSAYFFDRYTDAVTEYAAKPGFSCDAGFSKYTQVMFDFARRRLYAFCASGLGSGDFLLSWFAFDMEAKTWSVPALYKRIEGIRRHCYLFPFPDGNGGAYIVAERDDVVDLEPKLRDTGENKYLWDELRLFHIPDLTSPENVTYTTIHAAFSERADEGIWSCITNNQSGSVFMDADGYLHVTYLYSLYDLSGRQPDLDPDRQYRHAVYRGMECVFNDRIPFAGEGDTGCKPFVTQGTDGTLYMILFILDRDGTRIGIWRARDALGRTWIREKTLPLRDGIRAGSSCISAVRDGSTQDGTVSCFFYGKSRAGGGGGNTVYTFTLSLEDYSMTPAVDVLGEYDLCVDHRLDRRAFSSAHTTKIVRTEHGAYAAFTYDHAVGDLTYSYDGQREDFCIVRLGEDGAHLGDELRQKRLLRLSRNETHAHERRGVRRISGVAPHRPIEFQSALLRHQKRQSPFRSRDIHKHPFLRRFTRR